MNESSVVACVIGAVFMFALGMANSCLEKEQELTTIRTCMQYYPVDKCKWIAEHEPLFSLKFNKEKPDAERND